jgi:hypothetical protein
VWVANVNSITELNASNGSLVRVIEAKADGLYGPQAISVSNSHVWAENFNFESETELNASSGSLMRVIH